MSETTSLAVDVTVRRDDFEVSAAFQASAGETVTLLGPNGSGKSTLVSSIAGLYPLSGGRIFLDGVTLDGHGRAVPPEERPISSRICTSSRSPAASRIS